MAVGGQRHTPAALPPGKRLGTHCIVGCVAQGPVWTGAENLIPNGFRSPDRPARSESLYRLRHTGSRNNEIEYIFLISRIIYMRSRFLNIGCSIQISGFSC